MKTKLKLVFLVGVIVALMVVPGPAGAVIINFDNIAPGTIIDGVNLGGLTISSAPGSTMVANDFGVGWASPFHAIVNFNAFGGLDGCTTQPLFITYAIPQSSISLTGGDKGGDLDQFTVTAFDVANNIIGVVLTPVFGGNAIHPFAMVDSFTVNMTIPGIKTVVVSNAINFGIGLDNLQFCEVPLPPSVLLLASGLLGLFGLRRRFF